MTRVEVDFDHHSADHLDRWETATAALRAECPIGWTSAHGGFWVVVGYDAVREVARDPRTFSAGHDVTGRDPIARGIGIPPLDFPLILSESDPPLSTERRNLELPFFRAAQIRKWEPVVQDQVDACIRQMRSGDRADLFRDLAMPVVARTTLELVGVDADRWPDFSLAAHDDGWDDKARAAAMARVHEMLLHLADRRRAEPGRDITTALVQGRVGGCPLGDEEILSMLSVLVFGGFDTTAGLVTSGLIWLSRHRDVHPRLLAEPAVLGNAVEEFLRVFPSSLGVARNVTRDVVFEGQHLSRGDRVFLSWAAANRDPAVFHDPDSVLIDRPNASRHVSFGFGGHHCLGSELARLIAVLTIRSVLADLPDFRVDDDGLVRYRSPGTVVGWSKAPAALQDHRTLEGDT